MKKVIDLVVQAEGNSACPDDELKAAVYKAHMYRRRKYAATQLEMKKIKEALRLDSHAKEAYDAKERGLYMNNKQHGRSLQVEQIKQQ